jgi:hypothetical protein
MLIIMTFEFPGVHSDSTTASRIIKTIEQDCSKVLETGEMCWIEQVLEDYDADKEIPE